ncbi:YslB family protein [Bacillus massiliigorillae]|uniref:YslB family protein n=1 Tax=Bacillus massiliigorillae TaxID=1243664 RepID=UPI0003A8895E|nr:YslB family protein [Bacillus massiliigorillae]
MPKDQIIETEQTRSSETETVSIFSKEILRDIVLPDLLGKEHSEILYWAGKQLARKFPLSNMEETIEFFTNAGWGTLEELKSSKHEAEYILHGSFVARRFALNEDCEFQLEAGFLAQQLAIQNKRITEAATEQKRKANRVKFLVRWDTKDSIEE